MKSEASALVLSENDDKESSKDGPLVGTIQLLEESQRVTQPESVNKPIPTPSVYKDGRGEIHNILVGGSDDDVDDNSNCNSTTTSKRKRINILFTKAGVMRSGDIHKNTQHDFIFDGKVQVWTLGKDGSTIKKEYGRREYVCVPPFVPHIFHFLQDTTMAEWWEPEPFQAWFYEPYRELVDKSFSGLQDGRLVKLVVAPERHREDGASNKCKWRTGSSSSILLTALIGIAVGIMVGRRK